MEGCVLGSRKARVDFSDCRAKVRSGGRVPRISVFSAVDGFRV